MGFSVTVDGGKVKFVSYGDDFLLTLNCDVVRDIEAAKAAVGGLFFYGPSKTLCIQSGVTRSELNLSSVSSSRWYLAGPMRGIPLSNLPAFLVAAAWLRARGFLVINPAEHDIASGVDITKEQPAKRVEESLRWDFEQLAASDTIGIILLDGWERSVGAKAERYLAHLTGKKVLRLSADFKFTTEDWTPELTWTRGGVPASAHART